MKIICFDVNGTITDQTPWDLFVFDNNEIKEAIKNIFIAYNNKEISLDVLWKEITIVIRNNGKYNREYLLSGLERITTLKEGTVEIMAYLKDKGYKIYLVSCSLDIHLDYLVKKLKLDGFYSGTDIFFDEKGEIISIINRCYENKEFKEEKVKEIAKINNASVEDIVFVGDGKNDIGSFKITKKGIAMDSRVDELIKVSWKNIKKLEEIKNII
ncbi:MAG: HAD-IB family phosphatase [Candidatus Paceibacterota bacterium]|jgi:HAD superfamily phosphoserine phosphatase-like hydrolase